MGNYFILENNYANFYSKYNFFVSVIQPATNMMRYIDN